MSEKLFSAESDVNVEFTRKVLEQSYAKTALAGTIGAGAGSAIVLSTPIATIAATPANVTAAVTDIESTMTSLGTLAASALALALGVVGIAMAIGYGKKIMSKG